MPAMPFSSLTFDVTTEDGWHNMRRWLVGHRRRMRLTQRQVADRMGSTQDVVSQLERGVTDPRISTLHRYMRALELQGLLGARDHETGELL